MQPVLNLLRRKRTIPMDDDTLFPNFPDWQQCYSLYLQNIFDKSGSSSSRRSCRSILRMFFADTERDPATYVRSDILSFLAQPSQSLRSRGHPLAANTKNCRVSMIRNFYRFASDYDVRQADGTIVPLFRGLLPTRGMTYLARDRKIAGLSIEEVDRFFSVIDESPRGIRDKAIFTLFLLCGKRRAELLCLRWGDISEGTVTDKDGSQRRAYLFQYRRKGHQREISQAELPAAAYQAVHRYLVASGRLASMTPRSPLFVAMRPGSGRRARSDYEPLAMSSVAMIFHGYLEKCGLADKGYGLHALRHASAAARYMLGADVKSIQSVLDHSSLFTTSIYLESLVTSGDEGAKLLEKRFAYLTVR